MANVLNNRIYPLRQPDIKPSPCPLIHERCQGDLDKLYPTKKQQAILKTQLKKRMDLFQSHLMNYADCYPFFEFFGNYNDHGTSLPVYVMRFNKIKDLNNLRIFFIVKDNQMIMLHAFLEKGKKTYGPAYEVVKSRLS